MDNLLNWKNVSLVPSHENREQGIDLIPILALDSLNFKIITPHQHFRYIWFPEKILQTLNSRVVLKVRDIYDTVLSCSNHVHYESVIVPAAFMSKEIWNTFFE